MGGGTTRTASQLQKTRCVCSSGTRMMIKSDCNMMLHDGNYDKDDKGGGGSRQGGPPLRGKNTPGVSRQGGGIGDCQGGTLRGRPGSRWQRSIPAHGGGNGWDRDRIVVNRCIRGVVVVGSGDNDNHPGIVVTATMPRTLMTMKSWLGSWWGPVIGHGIMAGNISC
jgi:hypothetical protein